jgi:hypothetical protein
MIVVLMAVTVRVCAAFTMFGPKAYLLVVVVVGNGRMGKKYHPCQHGQYPDKICRLKFHPHFILELQK